MKWIMVDFLLKPPRGETLRTTAKLKDAIEICTSCKDYLKMKQPSQAVSRQVVAVLRGGTDMNPELILCKDKKEAKKVISMDVDENINSGEVFLTSREFAGADLGACQTVGTVDCATVNRYGQFQWWKILADEDIHSSTEYNL